MAFPPIPNRNQLLASRAQVAREERAAVERVQDLRWIMDSMTDELRQTRIDPVRTAALIVAAGDAARAGAPVRLPAKGSAARLILDAGERARGRKPDDAE
jgi:hypothetical protein